MSTPPPTAPASPSGAGPAVSPRPTRASDDAAAAALGFSDQPNELTCDALEVEGQLPGWLSGSLLRTGPARWDLADGRSVNHWFDGLAMLHRFSFADGAVGYANRLLRGKAGTAYEKTGQLGYREFASDPCRTTFQRVASLFDPGLTDNGAVNVGRLGDRWLAMTETPMAVVFDPNTLESLGVEQRSPKLSLPNAHPHYDHASGDMLDLRVAIGPRSSYQVVARHPNGGERVLGSIPVRQPGYQHSFGLTANYVIVSEAPYVVNPLRLATSGKPFIENFRWKPEQGSRLWAIDRRSGETLGPWTAPAFFCFHHVNAFERDGEIVVDLLAFRDAGIVEALKLANLRAGGSGAARTQDAPHLHRYVLRPGQTTTEPERLSETSFELPRINGRRTGLPYDVVYGVGPRGADGALATITRTTISDGRTQIWDEPDSYAGEPIFVRRPEGTAEDDGVLLSVVLEPERNASSLLVLDAKDLREVARARVPQHIPFGFHGQFARAEQLP